MGGLQKAVFYDVPYYVILNTAIGGSWPGPPDSKTVLPTYHYVGYVRVAQSSPRPPPVCSCTSPILWPVSGCEISKGARCGSTCCCIPGVGSCPPTPAPAPKPQSLASAL